MLSRAASNPQVQKTGASILQKGAEKVMNFFSRAPISTVAKDTRVEHGRVMDPGHIQFKTTPTEQQKYGLQPTYGFSPKTDAPKTHVTSTGQMPNGETVTVKGFKTEGRRLDQDPPIKTPDRVHDHGEITQQQADKLKDMAKKWGDKTYEVSGSHADNCVTAHSKISDEVFGLKTGAKSFERPQDQAKKVSDFHN